MRLCPALRVTHKLVGDVRDRCRWQKKGALRMWLVLGYAEHCKFAFGKHCSGRKNQGKRKPADFFGHRNRKGALGGPQCATNKQSTHSPK